MKRILIRMLLLLGVASLAACNSGGGEDSASIAGGGRGGSSVGFLTLSLTDAPIDNADEVWIQVTGVTLKHEASSGSTTVPINPPKNINVLALQGMNSMPLFINEALPAGNYNWIRLEVNAVKDGVLDSYIKLNDGSVHELDIPSGEEVGLKLIGGLRLNANVPTEVTVDFDLRKSIVATGSGEFKMKPVLSMVEDELAGAINGTVKLSTLTDPSCSDNDPATGNAIYLFDGFNVTPDDVDGIGPDPVMSALVSLNNATGQYEYEFGFVPFGKYTARFTCQADLDDPTTDDAIVFANKGKNVQVANTNTRTLPGNTFR